MTREYKIVKKEESPTIPLNKVSLNKGFIIVTSDGDSVGIIVYDSDSGEYGLIDRFYDDFNLGIDFRYSHSDLEPLMDSLRAQYCEPVEFNFIPVGQ